MPRLAASLSAALALLSATARAAFPYPTCTTGPGFDPPFPVSIGAREFDPKAENPPGGPSDGSKYALDTSSSWHLYMNPNVVQLQPYYGFFQTEAGFDTLKVQDGSTTRSYSGNLNATSSPVAASSAWAPMLGLGIINAVYVSWSSDYSVANALPPSFSQ